MGGGKRCLLQSEINHEKMERNDDSSAEIMERGMDSSVELRREGRSSGPMDRVVMVELWTEGSMCYRVVLTTVNWEFASRALTLSLAFVFISWDLLAESSSQSQQGIS